jgi:hypothetical protein
MSTIDRLLARYHAIYEAIALQYLSSDEINNNYNEAALIAFEIGYLLGTRKLEAMKLEIMHHMDFVVDRHKFFAGYQSGALTRKPKPVAGAWDPWEFAGLS